MEEKTIGIIGGGHFGRMLIQAAQNFGIRTVILDPDGSNSPAGKICQLIIEGSYNDLSKISELSLVADVVLIDIEVDAHITNYLKEKNIKIFPSADIITNIQDKLKQKVFFSQNNIFLPSYWSFESLNEIELDSLISKLTFPVILKKRFASYVGKSILPIQNETECQQILNSFDPSQYFIEEFVYFQKELSIIATKDSLDKTALFPIIEIVKEENVCLYSFAPAQISQKAQDSTIKLAKDILSLFKSEGIFTIDFFLLSDDNVMLKKVTPRADDSALPTIESCNINLFEMTLRTIFDLSCPMPSMISNYALTINILGQEDMESTRSQLITFYKHPQAFIHWYEKDNKLGCKMGHITIVENDIRTLRRLMRDLGINEKIIFKYPLNPKIAIIMESSSNLPQMVGAIETIEKFGVEYEVDFVSAHKTPEKMYSFAKYSKERGIQVIIAGGEGSAHLPGTVASLTSLPVIGVPMSFLSSNGQDALFSIIQMPKGVPVATMGIDQSINAALLAIRILSLQENSLCDKLSSYIENEREKITEESVKLVEKGWKHFLKHHMKS